MSRWYNGLLTLTFAYCAVTSRSNFVLVWAILAGNYRCWKFLAG